MGGPWEDYTTASEETPPWMDYAEATPKKQITPAEYSAQMVADPKFRAMREQFIRESLGNKPTTFGNILRSIQKTSPILSYYDVAGKLTDEAGGTELPELPYERKSKGLGVVANVKEAMGNIPASAARLTQGTIEMPGNIAEAVREQGVAGGLGSTVGGMVEGIGTSLGLKGAEAAANRWVGYPVEAAADVAMLYPAAKGVAKGTPKLARSISDVGLRAIDKLPLLSDEALYRQALEPGSSISRKGQMARERAVQTGLEQGIVITPSGDVYIGKGINDIVSNTFGEDAGLVPKSEAIVTSPQFKSQRVSLDSIETGAKSEASELAAGNRTQARSAVENVVKELKEDPSYDSETNTISAEAAYRQKQSLYKTLQKSYEQDTVVGLKDAQMNVASQLREATGRIAEEVGLPELKTLLEQQGDNLNFIKYAKKRMEKLTTGGIIGKDPLAWIMNTPKYIMLRTINSPNFKSRLAIAINNAKKRAASPMEIETIVKGLNEQFNPETLPPAAPSESGLGDVIPGGRGRSIEEGAIPPAVNLPIDQTTGMPYTPRVPNQGARTLTGLPPSTQPVNPDLSTPAPPRAVPPGELVSPEAQASGTIATPTDWHNIHTILLDNMNVVKGRSKGKYYTDSAFWKYLREYYPSVGELSAYGKQNVMTALEKLVQKRRLTPAQEHIRDAFLHDIEGAKSRNIPSEDLPF